MSYLPEVKHIFATFNVKDISPSKFRSHTGFGVGKLPSGVAFNSATNKIYVVNTGSDSVSVLDGDTYHILNTIKVGRTPQGIALDPALTYVGIPCTFSTTQYYSMKPS
jgi:YVTN family beta-propeller protein